MTAAALAKARAPQIDVIVESALWESVADAEATVQRALVEAAHVVGADFDHRTVAILLTDDAAIRRLNAQWRGLDKPTNVLSFPPAPGTDSPRETKSLGDIAIAYETSAREAQSEDKRFADHLAHLAVHGFLHLLGYDHEADTQAEQMEQLERVILARLGISDPYLTHPAEEVRG
jgi:probable rRNA maturation factor